MKVDVEYGGYSTEEEWNALMKKRMTGSGFYPKEKPVYKWTCKKCKFKGQLWLWLSDETITKHDIYDSCSGGFLIVHSDEDGDYISSVSLESMFAVYVAYMKGL